MTAEEALVREWRAHHLQLGALPHIRDDALQRLGEEEDGDGRRVGLKAGSKQLPRRCTAGWRAPAAAVRDRQVKTEGGQSGVGEVAGRWRADNLQLCALLHVQDGALQRLGGRDRQVESEGGRSEFREVGGRRRHAPAPQGELEQVGEGVC